MIPRGRFGLVDFENWPPNPAGPYERVRPAIKRGRDQHAVPVRRRSSIKSVLDGELYFVAFVDAYHGTQVRCGKPVCLGRATGQEGVLTFGCNEFDCSILVACIDQLGNWQRSSGILTLRRAAAQQGDGTDACLKKSAARKHSSIAFH
jgi:hypothetical protein